MDLQERINILTPLLDSLQHLTDLPSKNDYLDQQPSVKLFLQSGSPFPFELDKLSLERSYLLKALIAIHQERVIFNIQDDQVFDQSKVEAIFNKLQLIESFYSFMGGIIGYYLTILKLILAQKGGPDSTAPLRYYSHPQGMHLGQNKLKAKQAVRWGIDHLDRMAEIYPVGGAGDRLNLVDEASKQPLPAAMLPFLGFTLLEGLIRDLQSREYLYFKLYRRQILVPVAMMTSKEKGNSQHIQKICQSLNWFGRPRSSFRFFEQPLIPVVTVEGDFAMSDTLTFVLKPGGHGVIWKLAEERGIFHWLDSLGCLDCIVRQINNPLAGIDQALLALFGYGFHHKKAMGFLSCERLLKSSEGTNVLIETETSDGYEYRLTCIEYTDFSQYGIKDEPASPDSPYSIFPTNTNVFFAHLPSIRKALKHCTIPGQLINMKTKVSVLDVNGQRKEILGGRLESTMQNIADYIVDKFSHKLSIEAEQNELQTFILFNDRLKTISATKTSYRAENSPIGTPEQAYYDLLANHFKLFREECHFQLPFLGSIEEVVRSGPPAIIAFHPALGPLYQVISQKIGHGSMTEGSEIVLEIAELDLHQLVLSGSLLIEAKQPLGTIQEGLITYGHESRCSLNRVTIRNQGIDRSAPNIYWQNQVKRKEACHIILCEGAEFHAEEITIEGNQIFEVPAFHRMVVTKGGRTECYPLEHPTWEWHYHFDNDNNVLLNRAEYDTKRKSSMY